MDNDEEQNSFDFCVDTFLGNKRQGENASVCLTKTSLCLQVQQYLLPTFYAISLIFLMITIVSHLLTPRILANGGLHQLCYVIALSVAYTTSFSVHVFHNSFSYKACFDLAIARQFGYLTTFFWLNVMCFEIWRKIRRLKNYRPCKFYPYKYYMMYGWGIPFFISVINILIEKYGSEVSRSWFKDDLALLICFYGPVAVLLLFNSVLLFLTYIDYKVMLRNYKETSNALKELEAGVNREQRKRYSRIPSRQIANHVHDFNQKLKIFVFMATCWVINLVRAILPLQLRLLLDTLNSLQGFSLFIILLSNSNKRKHLKKKYPRLFRWIKKSNQLPANMERGLQNSGNRTLSTMSSLTSSISSQFSISSIIKTLITSIRSSNSSSSSFDVQNTAAFDNNTEGVIVLSYSSLRKSDSTQGSAYPSLQSSKSPEITPDSAC